MTSDRPLKIRWKEQEWGARRTAFLSPVPLLYSHPKYLQPGHKMGNCRMTPGELMPAPRCWVPSKEVHGSSGPGGLRRLATGSQVFH